MSVVHNFKSRYSWIILPHAKPTSSLTSVDVHFRMHFPKHLKLHGHPYHLLKKCLLVGTFDYMLLLVFNDFTSLL